MTPLVPGLVAGLIGMAMWGTAAGLARTPRAGNRLPDPRTYPVLVAVSVLALVTVFHPHVSAQQVPLVLLVAFGVPAAYTDARELRLPDLLTYGLATSSAAAVVVLVVTGSSGSVTGAIAGGLGYPLLLTAIAVLTPTRTGTAPAVVAATDRVSAPSVTRPTALGLGDVKLATGIGITVGWTSAPALVTALLLTAVGHLVWVIGCSLARRGGLRTAMAGTALGPWMVAGGIAAIVLASQSS